MPRGRPAPPPKIKPSTLTEELRSLHKLAEDPNEESFPAPDDYPGWVRYAELHAKVLPDDSKKRSGIICILLIRLLTRELESLLHGAVRTAKSGGARHEDLAVPLGVRNKGSVTKLIQRLEVEALRSRGELAEDERRAPETHRNLRMAKAAALATLVEAQGAAQGLLAHRNELLTDEGIEEDLDYLATLMRPEQVMALGASLRLVVRDIRELAAATARPAARTTAAAEALTRVEKMRT